MIKYLQVKANLMHVGKFLLVKLKVWYWFVKEFEKELKKS